MSFPWGKGDRRRRWMRDAMYRFVGNMLLSQLPSAGIRVATGHFVTFAMTAFYCSMRIRWKLLVIETPHRRRDEGIPPYGFVRGFQSCIVGRPDPRPPLVQAAVSPKAI